MSKFISKAFVALVSVGIVAGAFAVPQMASAYPSYVCKYEEKKSSKNGTLIGAVAGGVIGGSVANTHNKGLGTVVGALAGGAIGSKVGRNHGKTRCQDETAYRSRTVYERDSRGHKRQVIYRYVRR